MTSIIELKLKYSHPVTQCQGVEQIVKIIKNSVEKTGNTNAASSEIELLWKYSCSGEDKFVRNLCADALLSLVTDGILNPNIVLKTTVNYTATSARPNTLIYLIQNLLIGKIVAAKKDDANECKLVYKLRSPPHPFISTMISNPRCIPAVYSTISTLLSTPENSGFPNNFSLLNFVKSPLVYISEDNAKVDYPLKNVIQCICTNDSANRLNLETVYSILIAKNITITTFDSYIYFINLLGCSTEKGIEILLWGILLKVCGYTYSYTDSILAYKIICDLGKWISNEKAISSEYFCLLIMFLSDLMATGTKEVITASCSFLNKTLAAFNIQRTDQYVVLLLLKATLINLTLLTENNLLRRTKNHVFNLYNVVEGKLKNFIFSSAAPRSFCLDGLHDSYTIEQISRLQLYCGIITTPRSFIGLIGSCINKSDNVFSRAFCVLLLHGIHDEFSDELFKKAMKYLIIYSKSHSEAALDFAPIIMHCLKSCPNGDKNLALLYTLPSIVHHPSSLPYVLNAIKLFSNVPSLLPLSIRLLVELWKLHDKCYPTLHNLIITSNLKSKHNEDALLKVQCIAIFEICKTRPHKYASEMIQLLTSILNLSNKKSVEAAIAVDAVHVLCDSEALDIVSTWNTLLKNIWSKSDGLVTAAILRLMSLVEKLAVYTDEYKQFKFEILASVWSKLVHENDVIACAALKSLSCFNPAEFSIACLPTKFKPAQNNEDTDEQDIPIPGYIYINILLTLRPAVYEGFQMLYKSILRHELTEMPRDIKHRAMRQHRKSTQSMLMADVPEYILRMYERNKTPSLKPNLAFALLISHNPVNLIGQDGKVIYRMCLSRGKSFFKLMLTLLGEISLDPNDWQHVLWVSKGWEIFMERCLTAMVEGRKAELEMQLEHSTGDTRLTREIVEEIQNKQHNAHLSCRDQIMTELIAASKESPAKQGNSAMALAGLASACSKFETQQSTKTEAEAMNDSTYVSNKHWVTKVADTLMCIADSNFKPPGRIFSWCQYNSVSKTGRLSTTQLGKICAIHGFNQMFTALFPKHNVKILNMLELLISKAFPSRSTDAGGYSEDRSAYIYRHACIILGQFLGKTLKDNCRTALGPEAKKMLDKSFTYFLKETAYYDPNMPNESDSDETGIILGLGYMLSAYVCYSEDNDIRVQALEPIKVTKSHLEYDCNSQLYTNALCFTMSLLCSSGTSTAIIDSKISSECLTILINMHEKDDQQLGTAQALGTLANSLFFSNNKDILNHILSLYSQWSKVLLDSKTNLRIKIAAMVGISCLAGANNSLLHVTQNPDLLTNVQYNNMLNNVMKILRTAAGNQTNARLQAVAIPLISQLALSYESVSEAESQMAPTSYNYLPETSVLKYTFSFLQECVKKNQSMDSTIPHMFLSVISELCDTVPLPPINFAAQLTLFDQYWKSESILNKSLLIALSQSSKSPTAVSYVSIWISAPTFYELSLATKILLYSKMHVIYITQHVSKVEIMFAWGMREMCEEKVYDLTYTILSSAKECLKRKDTSNLHKYFGKSTEYVYNALELDVTNESSIKLWTIIAECLSCDENANEIVGQWKKSDRSDGKYQDLVLKALFIRCYCTSIGLHPFNLCNDVIEESAKLDVVFQMKSLWTISTTLGNLKHSTSKINKQIEWLQEVMGFIKQFTAKCSTDTGRSILFFMLRVFSTLVVCWQGDNHSIGILSLTNHEFRCMTSNEHKQLWDTCFQHLMSSLPKLLERESWCDVSGSLIEWLIFLHKNINKELVDIDILNSIKQTICNLRHSNSYNRPSIWMEAANILHDL